MEDAVRWFSENLCTPPTEPQKFVQHTNTDADAGLAEKDQMLVRANESSMGYDSANFWHIHAPGPECDGDKAEPRNAPHFTQTQERFTKLFNDLKAELEATRTTLTSNTEEQLVADIASKFPSMEGYFDTTDAVSTSCSTVLEKSNAAGDAAHTALYEAVKATRTLAAYDGYKEHVENRSAIGGAVRWAVQFELENLVMQDRTNLDEGFTNTLNEITPESIRANYYAAAGQGEGAIGEMEDAISKHQTALEDWSLQGLNTMADIPDKNKVHVPYTGPQLIEEKKEEDAPPAVSPGGGSGGGAPSEPPAEKPDPVDSLKDELKDLLNSDPASGMPDLGSGLGGGGMPDMGAGGGGVPDLGSGLGSGMEPMSELLDEAKPADEEELEDLDEELGEDEPPVGEEEPLLEDGDGTESTVEGEGAVVAPEEQAENPEGDTPPVDAAAPPAEAGAPADNLAARTVDLGNGRMATFPTEKLAALGGELVRAAGEGNPSDLYMAASKAGLELPPMGQDIGTPISPSQLQEGDAVIGSDLKGLYVGNSEVLCEDGQVHKIDELTSTFAGPDNGLFRIDPEADPLGGGEAPSQPVSADTQEAAVSAAPADAPIQESEPGVPTNDGPPAGDSGDTEAPTLIEGMSDQNEALSPSDIFVE